MRTVRMEAKLFTRVLAVIFMRISHVFISIFLIMSKTMSSYDRRNYKLDQNVHTTLASNIDMK